LYASNVH